MERNWKTITAVGTAVLLMCVLLFTGCDPAVIPQAETAQSGVTASASAKNEPVPAATAPAPEKTASQPGGTASASAKKEPVRAETATPEPAAAETAVATVPPTAVPPTTEKTAAQPGVTSPAPAKNERSVSSAAAAPHAAATQTAAMEPSASPAPAATADAGAGLVLLFTNDTHGRALNDADEPSIGYSRVARLKQQLEEQGKNVLLLSAGDECQGTPLVNLDHGSSAIQFMNAAGYDAMVFGNHEFDWGADNALALAKQADFPVLAANLTRTAGGDLLTKGNHVFAVGGGLKVGVFGLTTPETQTKSNPGLVRGLTFAAEQELYDCAQKQVDALKEQGCDVVICLGHLGVDDTSAPNRSRDVLENVTGIDLFIDGHSHTEVNEKVGNSLLVQTGYYGHNVGRADYDGNAFTAQLVPAVEDDPAVTELIAAANDAVSEELSKPFATSEVDLNGEREPGVRTEETNLGDFACDAVLWQARQATGKTVDGAVINGGNIRASIAAGEITMNDIKTVFPFDNTLCVVTLTGAELLEGLEAATWCTPKSIAAFPQVAGIEYTVDSSVPYKNGRQYPDSTFYAPAQPGARVTIRSVGGKPFDPQALYRIATTDFIAAGGDSYYAFRYGGQTSSYDTGVALEDALTGYVAELGGVIGREYEAPQGRVTIL